MQNGIAYRRQYGGSSKNKKIELPGDLATPLMGIYPKELKSGPQRGIRTPVFTIALFTTARMWKHPNCQSTDEFGINIQWNIIQP